MSNATKLLCDIIRYKDGTMTKTEIKAKWTGTDWGKLRGWALWNWRNAGL